VADVECYGVRVHLPEPGRWYDTRPMLDPREHSGPVLDMHAELLQFGQDTGALVRHPSQPHLLRATLENAA
jgi:hypothetical protein